MSAPNHTHGTHASAPSGDSSRLRFYAAPHLDTALMKSWRAFAETVPGAHYMQDPGWAEIERRGGGGNARAPHFFWATDGDELRLTAIGIRRRLPIPGRVFWEFNRGPLTRDLEVLDTWLGWLTDLIGHETARLRVQPALPLAAGGDEAETLLERRGFQRHRVMGGWTTLTVDLRGDERETLASFRSATQRAIKKSGRLGIEVVDDNTLLGRSALARLQTELAFRAPVEAADPAYLGRVCDHWLGGGHGGTILVARHEGEPVAAGLVIIYCKTAYLPLIPSSRHHRELPASHLLVWEAMQWAKLHGCQTFDLVGYSMTARPGDPLAGINQFKRGFASLDRLSRSVAIHERVSGPLVVASAVGFKMAQARLGRRWCAT